ncbi:deoxyribose-phosphate aldolase [Erysipelothrix rhusiopathiae]|uniref:Deoxyribose-phosphate aldolase n=1 Tax=Erysipelothrix rhusiopathiae ATCC 19414 TaxID=525280 RepID=E7FUC8_ERYRH|nr:deoxyribose-phosphate aldolase [Erysipelothrix rhusiopathiae]AGN24197.1 deoxyribose-phosphate aldolase [Erysipelothrix rhusiopathiae SY1027]AMS11028.1 2-deoxyribose-5-phosphate aldolase [Erysipelothrix rhusiopathiae]AOO67526.1 deoxyribose-phosphate aldolase [Erysipelothrix rhusiopathiae]AWU41609.1 deoxyribose-phosphate aldolase [Erysipelothrix rhusiopathiae]AYV34504.1 deoxyribose-phosphate aldolase [Erysipelothrix rhusiopathiae]
MKLSKYIDHTLLKQNATEAQIRVLCDEAKEYDFMSVCINPGFVSLCNELLSGTDVKVCTVIGFPLGANTTEVKVFETKNALENGADEIDMVINVSALKDKKYDLIENEIRSIKDACGENILKVIIETCLLEDDEIVKVCELAVAAGADFVKTSTGFSTGGATFEAVKLMKDTVKNQASVKASGGVRSQEDMESMIEAGATRIGTSSGVALVKNEVSQSDY